MERKRIASWWVRWPDLNWPSHDNLDKIKRRAEGMAEADVTAAMIFGTHFRWDYMPFFTMLHDYLATVAEELHKNGVKLYDHHSVNLIHRYHDGDVEAMRHVMLHSGPHLPFCPSYEAAENWEYNGMRLNDWRMIDVKTRDVLWHPQYASEGFCHRNPDFIEGYRHYLRRLIADTGIDGLSADDTVYYMHYNACACPHCRAELQRRAGIDLPTVEDQGFWGNWENPAWHHWVDLRMEATGEFFAKIKEDLPEGFELMSCGASSATSGAMSLGSDARKFLRGCTMVNLEMSGNTPPYKGDPVTVNSSMSHRLINSSHHLAAGRETGAGCFGTGYGFTQVSADHVWAVNKALGSSCWFSTLKQRLGLPDHVLDTLPDEWDLVGHAFGFEKNHPELFGGSQVGQLAVYFSYETRNHTFFGALGRNGYYRDYHITLKELFRAGLSPHTVFEFPAGPEEYPIVLLPSAAAVTEEEKAKLKAYLAAGGKVVATGPSPLEGCENGWKLPGRPDVAPQDFFSGIRDGVWYRPAQWEAMEVAEPEEEDAWREPVPGLYYHPFRMSGKKVIRRVMELCREYAAPMPLKVLESEGYLVTMFRDEKGIVAHFLAAEYDVDIDHALDEARFHRSRVNFVNKAEAIGVTDTLRLETEETPKVWLPLNDGAEAGVTGENGVVTVKIPKNCSYIVMRFEE